MRIIKRSLCVTMIMAIMIMVNIYVPVCGETTGMEDGEKNRMESRVSENSVRKQENKSISDNSTPVEDNDEILADTDTIVYSGKDGDLSWSITDGSLTIVGTGDYDVSFMRGIGKLKCKYI